MVNVFVFLVYLSFLCALNYQAKSTKKYEYINLLSTNDYTDKIQTLKKYSIKDNNAPIKNKYVFSCYGSSGHNKKKILEYLFNISTMKKNCINLGFQQKLDLWFGMDKYNNLNVVLDVDLLQNKEFSENIGNNIYNYEKLINFIVESTNSIIIPLLNDDICFIESINRGVENLTEKQAYSVKNIEEKNENCTLVFPKKMEIFLNQLNEKGKNVHVYFVLMDDEGITKQEKKGWDKDINYEHFVKELKKKYYNLKNIYLMKKNKINLDFLQKNNINKYTMFVNNLENVMKELNNFKNFCPFNENCVYNIYVIEESYNKTLNQFDKIFNAYEKEITQGNVIPNYGILSSDLIKNSLLFFHILTFEQTGTKFKDTIFEKLEQRFLSLIRKQIIKQLLLIEKQIINKGKNTILNKYYEKKDKDLISKDDKIKLLKNSLTAEFKEGINKLIPNEYFKKENDMFNNTMIEEYVDQFVEKVEQTLKNYYQLNQSPLKKLFEKKKIAHNMKDKRKKWFNPSLNLNLTLTSLVRKSGYGNLQSYFIYDLGMLTFVFGLLNDRDTPEVQQQGDKVPFFKFQPKVNLKINFK
ncbi:hypothetical protein, conserved [Plasmodium gonderi]|uniref:Uncharacterized protein n=1 Tax=Plasmodium gonderi TaxID=77519 RepID=A0A1Y1JGZ2_PLAGO|nr:hypothetical protein, conserved [Plasmodium gonderi]GAW81786.1 hypothetical protein, conserved [Plasmodium gonderi]